MTFQDLHNTSLSTHSYTTTTSAIMAVGLTSIQDSWGSHQSWGWWTTTNITSRWQVEWTSIIRHQVHGTRWPTANSWPVSRCYLWRLYGRWHAVWWWLRCCCCWHHVDSCLLRGRKLSDGWWLDLWLSIHRCLGCRGWLCICRGSSLCHGWSISWRGLMRLSVGWHCRLCWWLAINQCLLTGWLALLWWLLWVSCSNRLSRGYHCRLSVGLLGRCNAVSWAQLCWRWLDLNLNWLNLWLLLLLLDVSRGLLLSVAWTATASIAHSHTHQTIQHATVVAQVVREVAVVMIITTLWAIKNVPPNFCP